MCQEWQQGEKLNYFLTSLPSLPRTSVGNGLALRVYARSQKALLETHLVELFLHWGWVSLLHLAPAHSYLFYGPSRALSPCRNPEHQHQSTCRLTSGFWGPLRESRIKTGLVHSPGGYSKWTFLIRMVTLQSNPLASLNLGQSLIISAVIN